MLFHLTVFSLAALVVAFPHEKRQSGLKAFDVSQAQAPFNPNFWKCTHDNGYQKVVIRGWQVSNLSFDLGFMLKLIIRRKLAGMVDWLIQTLFPRTKLQLPQATRLHKSTPTCILVSLEETMSSPTGFD